MGTALPALVLLCKITVVLLAAFGVSLALRRASAGARHLVWLVALAALLALPALAAWGPLRVPVLPERFAVQASADIADDPVAPDITSDAAPVGPTAPSAEPELLAPSGAAASGELASNAPASNAPASNAPASGGSAGAASAPGFGTILLGAWALVALGLAGWLAYGAWSVRRIVRRAKPLEHSDWQTPLYEISDRLGLEAAPRLVRSGEVKMPFAAGLLTPTIVLPAESDGWSAERRSAVLVHELGHVRRRDLVGHTLGRVACALYWFHPLVWSAARRLRSESERACDDLALVFGLRPADYAEHLLDIVACVREHNTPAVALAMAHRKEFEGRMLAILDPGLRRREPSRLTTLPLAGGLAAIALLVGAAAPAPRQAEVEAPIERMGVPVPGGTDTPAQVAAPFVSDTDSLAPPRSRAASARAPAKASASAGETARMSAAITGSAIPSLADGESNVDHDVEVDEADAQASNRSDDERAAVLAKTLRTDPSAEVRRVAAWGLERYARSEVAVEALVAAATNDASADVREMAVWALAEARKGSPAAAALVRAARSDRDAEVRTTAIWALGALGDPQGMEALVAALGDASAEVRELAAWGIGSIEPDRAPAALVSALADRSRDVRLSVVWALYSIEDPATAGALDAAFRRETDTEVRHGIVRALVRVGGESVEALEGLVTSSDSTIRSLAVAALAGGDAAGPWPWPRPWPRPYP